MDYNTQQIEIELAENKSVTFVSLLQSVESLHLIDFDPLPQNLPSVYLFFKCFSQEVPALLEEYPEFINMKSIVDGHKSIGFSGVFTACQISFESNDDLVMLLAPFISVDERVVAASNFIKDLHIEDIKVMSDWQPQFTDEQISEGFMDEDSNDLPDPLDLLDDLPLDIVVEKDDITDVSMAEAKALYVLANICESYESSELFKDGSPMRGVYEHLTDLQNIKKIKKWLAFVTTIVNQTKSLPKLEELDAVRIKYPNFMNEREEIDKMVKFSTISTLLLQTVPNVLNSLNDYASLSFSEDCDLQSDFNVILSSKRIDSFLKFIYSPSLFSEKDFCLTQKEINRFSSVGHEILPIYGSIYFFLSAVAERLDITKVQEESNHVVSAKINVTLVQSQLKHERETHINEKGEKIAVSGYYGADMRENIKHHSFNQTTVVDLVAKHVQGILEQVGTFDKVDIAVKNKVACVAYCLNISSANNDLFETIFSKNSQASPLIASFLKYAKISTVVARDKKIMDKLQHQWATLQYFINLKQTQISIDTEAPNGLFKIMGFYQFLVDILEKSVTTRKKHVMFNFATPNPRTLKKSFKYNTGVVQELSKRVARSTTGTAVTSSTLGFNDKSSTSVMNVFFDEKMPDEVKSIQAKNENVYVLVPTSKFHQLHSAKNYTLLQYTKSATVNTDPEKGLYCENNIAELLNDKKFQKNCKILVIATAGVMSKIDVKNVVEKMISKGVVVYFPIADRGVASSPQIHYDTGSLIQNSEILRKVFYIHGFGVYAIKMNEKIVYKQRSQETYKAIHFALRDAHDYLLYQIYHYNGLNYDKDDANNLKSCYQANGIRAKFQKQRIRLLKEESVIRTIISNKEDLEKESDTGIVIDFSEFEENYNY